MIISENHKFNKEEKVLIECDFKISDKCKNQYSKLYKNILKGRLNNNGKDRCQYCCNSLTKSGSNNINFKYNKNETFFDNIDSELKAYMLGFIAGDASIKKDGLYFENHVSDIEILKLFKNYISPNSEFYKHHDLNRGKNTICLKIHSVKIVKSLLKHLKLEKYGKKSNKILLPDFSDELLWHFLRGLFDSDGTIISPYKKLYPVASICSTSRQMRLDIRKFCDKTNTIYYNTEGNSSVIFGGINCLDFLNKLYKDANFYLHRKYDYYKIWQTWKKGMGTIVKSRKRIIYVGT